MTTAGWFALGLALGSVGTLFALRPLLDRRYEDGIAKGYHDCCDDFEPRIDKAFQRGRAAGWHDMSRALIRDMGPQAARQLADRMEAMDRVEELTGGKRT